MGLCFSFRASEHSLTLANVVKVSLRLLFLHKESSKTVTDASF